MTVARALLRSGTLALAGCSLAPKTVLPTPPGPQGGPVGDAYLLQSEAALPILSYKSVFTDPRLQALTEQALANNRDLRIAYANVAAARAQVRVTRSEEHTSELQSLMRISYAVFCLKKKNTNRLSITLEESNTDSTKTNYMLN